MPVHASSANVFADLGFPNAEELSIQAEPARLIYLRIEQIGLSQAEAAERLGLKLSEASALMNGRHAGFSAERLFRLLNALDQDIETVVRRKPARAQRSGRVRVVAA